MKLKSFKGMPHELGGIDYTEGSEVEGGEYAVKIGTSGNEYIFDKESSEGDFLAKEYKKLNSNTRLAEDDPIALATFEQIAREQALTHAQRSVNEKGVDPFRNMYEEGQAKNGGVKYACGGAKDMYFNGGAMAFMPGGLIDKGIDGEGLTKKKIDEVTNLGNGGVNKYATGGYMGTDSSFMYDGGPYQSFKMPNTDGFDIPNPSLSLEQMGEYGITPPSYTTSGEGLNMQNPDVSLAEDQFPMTPMTMKGMEGNKLTPDEYAPEFGGAQMRTPGGTLPTIDEIDSQSEATGSATGGPGGFGDVQKALKLGADAAQAISPGTDTGSVGYIAEKGNTRQKSIAPTYNWASGTDMLGEAVGGMSQGAEMGKAAGPYGQAAGAAIGMFAGPIMRGMQDAKANERLQNQFKADLMQKNAEERRDEQWDAIARDVDSTELIDKDRYQGLKQLGGTPANKFAKQGGALPKNKGVYGYYANGGGIETDPVTGGNEETFAEKHARMRFKRDVDRLHSGITYQDLQGGPSYPVYDDLGNEIAGERNIGASSLSPGFNIKTNTPQPSVGTNMPQSRVAASRQLNNTMRMQEMQARPSAPQYYGNMIQNPCDDYGSNQGFGLYNEPRKYAQKGNYYNPESLQKNPFVGSPEYVEPTMAKAVGNIDNPDIRPNTLMNNETGESYNFKNGGGRLVKKKEFKPGGVNETDPPIFPLNVENIIAQDAAIRQREIDAAHYQKLLQSGIVKNQEPYNSGTVDYPPTSFLSQNSPGSPNAQFMGNRQSQDFHNELIASELVGGVAGAGISRAAANLNRSNELQKLWRIQEKGAKPTAQLAKEGKLGKHFQNEQSIKHFNDREKHFGEWFTNDKKDLDWYTKDREFLNPEIIELNVPKSELKNYQNYDKSLSRASDREFVIPLSEQKNYYAKGGFRETDPPMGPTGAPTGVAVSPTGNAYSSEYIGGRNKKRGVGSNDYGMIPANAEQYAYTFFGGNKPFTEADMTPEEYKSAVDLYNIREKSHTISYDDHDKVGSTNTSKAGMFSKLTHKPDIIRNLIGAAATKDGRIISDYNFGKKPLSEILKDVSLEDLMAWAHNNSPFVDKEAMAGNAINIKMPKRKK